MWRLATWWVPNPPSLWSVIDAALIWYFGNQIDARAEWLAVAHNLFIFAKAFGRDEAGRWVFAVNQDIPFDLSIVTDVSVPSF